MAFRKKVRLEKEAAELAERKRIRMLKPKKKKASKSYPFLKWLSQIKRYDYKSFLKSRYWAEVRKLILKRDNYKCTVCKSTDNLQVHHTTYRNHRNEHNNLQDLLTLCEDCHYEYHTTVEN